MTAILTVGPVQQVPLADRCVFFDELLEVERARQRTYVVYEPLGAGLACVDLRLRRGPDWWFARRWIQTAGGARPLYRLLDRLELRGFQFRVDRQPPKALDASDRAAWEERDRETGVTARQFLDGLSREERNLHAELFPDEAALLARGYDWDARRVYRHGTPLVADGVGRIVERDGDVAYEWVAVADEMTWRRYPIERLRVTVTTVGS